MAIWRNEICIKQYFTDDVSESTVKMICENLIRQLDKIRQKEEKNTTIKASFLDDFAEIIESFGCIVESIENKEDPTEWGHTSWVEVFDHCLRCLYDIGDTVIVKRGFAGSEKFLWIN